VIKCNAVTDPAIVRALYQASQDGVEIDMIVRGVCCLRAGVAGLSKRIRVRSVVGRFLEHSRVYYFGNGGHDDVYIGSPDLMERNMDRRVETLCPVRDRGLAAHIRTTVLEAYLRDNDRASMLNDDRYEPAPSDDPSGRVSAQRELLEWYTSRPHAHDLPLGST